MNICIETENEKDDTVNKAFYLPNYEQSFYLTNCQIYGSKGKCYKCNPGFAKRSVKFDAGYDETTIDECVNIAEDNLTCAVKGSTTASSLIPFEFEITSTNKNISIKKYEYCGAKTGYGDTATNYGVVQGQDMRQLSKNDFTGAIALINLKCRYFITLIPSNNAGALTKTNLDEINKPKYSIINPFATFTAGQNINWINSHLDVYPEVECLNSIDVTKHVQISNSDLLFVTGNNLTLSDTNFDFSSTQVKLEYWFVPVADYYARARCSKGKAPKFGTATILGNPTNFVQCETFPDLTQDLYDYTVWYNNMIAYDQYFFNIHGCKAETGKKRIPFLLIDSGEKNKVIFDKFTLRHKSADWAVGNAANLHRPIVCLDITTTTTLETELFTTVATDAPANRAQIDQNCAYGIINTVYLETEFDYSINDPSKTVVGDVVNNAAIVCRACKNGFKPEQYIIHYGLCK